MRIFVHGNCQAASYGACLRNLVAAEVYVAGEDSYDEAAACDLVLLQTEFADHALPGGPLPLRGQPVVPIPTFYFPGLAPDAIIEHNGGRALVSPSGVYNSSIALHGFLSGFSVEDTIALFNEDSFARLGFDEYWEPSRIALVADVQACGLDGAALFETFRTFGKFAFSPHHPVPEVIEAIARALVVAHGWPAATGGGHHLDPMARNGDWPLYPGMLPDVEAPRSFDFAFDPALPGSWCKSVIPLADYVQRAFAGYAALPAGSITSERLAAQADRYARLIPPARPRSVRAHVYADLPPSSYWRGSVGAVPTDQIDPVVNTKWKIESHDRVATAGSCFAQHIGRALSSAGRQFLDSEPPPGGARSIDADRRHFGIFSARYGNIYTARQLLQLVNRAIGSFAPNDKVWQRSDGRYVDPFRPLIEPAGFVTPTQSIAATALHLRSVLAMLERMDVFVFTLGLTETWEAASDGAVFPVAPGVVAGTMDPARYRFVNFRSSEVRADLRRTLDLMRDINPRLRVILTVSPVPLVATYENRHVLVSTTYSKSALRVAAEEIAADYDYVDYFPSYEMIAGVHSGGRWFAADRRSVTPEGVAHVMAAFRRHYLEDGAATGKGDEVPAASASPIVAEIGARARFLCDEEALARPGTADELRLDSAAL